jgi:ClpP class serine protease
MQLLYRYTVEQSLNAAFNKRVMPDAVAITVNSPGGSPVQSDLIYTRIAALAKETGIPVMTFAEDVAASGGQGGASGPRLFVSTYSCNSRCNSRINPV